MTPSQTQHKTNILPPMAFKDICKRLGRFSAVLLLSLGFGFLSFVTGSVLPNVSTLSSSAYAGSIKQMHANKMGNISHKKKIKFKHKKKIKNKGSVSSKFVNRITNRNFGSGKKNNRRIRIVKRVDNSINSSVGFFNDGLILLNITNNSAQQESASGSVTHSYNDCDYGTYCTIDLGGPKIISLNTLGDIRDGEVVDEELIDK